MPATPARHPQAWVQPSNPDAPPASKGQYAAPATTGSDDDPSMLKGYRDAPPASKGQYAAPATTGCDDDPSMPKGYRDAPPAIQGWYATAATTAHDDDPAAQDYTNTFGRTGYRPPHLRRQMPISTNTDRSTLEPEVSFNQQI
jgi:hypothetical protein